MDSLRLLQQLKIAGKNWHSFVCLVHFPCFPGLCPSACPLLVTNWQMQFQALNLLSQKEQSGRSKRTRWVKAEPVPFYFLIGGHNIMLVSTTHHHESAIGIHMSPLSWTSPPVPHPIPCLQAVTEPWVGLPVFYSNGSLAMYFTFGNVYVSMLLSQFVPSSLSLLYPKSISLCLCLYSCPI